MSCNIKPVPKPPIPSSGKIKNNLIKNVFIDAKLRSSTEYSAQYREASLSKIRDQIKSKIYGDNVSQLISEDKIRESEDWETKTNESESHKRKESFHKCAPYIRHFDKEKTFRDIITWPSKHFPRESEIFGNLSLDEQADIQLDKIAQSFADWWTDLGIENTPAIKAANVDRIKEMFSVDFDKHAARALTVVMKEMLCVPKQIALANSQPQASISESIRRQVLRDVAVEALPKSAFAFGGAMPRDMNFTPPNNHSYEQWIDIKDVPKNLESMESVWDGITGLKSTKDFFSWLRVHPDREIPKFLHDAYKTETIKKPSSQLTRISASLPPVLKEEEDEEVEKKRLQALEVP